MCGRYTIATSPQHVAATFGLQEIPDPEGAWERYNVAPTQAVPAVRASEAETRTFAWLKWGLIPSWAKDPKVGNSLINARADTVATKPSFRSAFKKRRCLVIADGFYEWKPGTKPKQPWHFCLKSHEPFGFAGLFEWWRNPADESDERETCTIITTDANAVLEPIHHRMPVILNAKDFDRWLDPDYANVETLGKLLVPFDPKKMEAFPVSTAVNSPRNQGQELVEPLDAA